MTLVLESQPNLEQCRCCMKSDKIQNMYGLFNNTNDEITKLYCKYTAMELEPGDGIPEVICFGCHHIIIQFKEFCEMCTNSDTVFREQRRLETTKVEIKDECSVDVDDNERPATLLIEQDVVKVECDKLEVMEISNADGETVINSDLEGNNDNDDDEEDESESDVNEAKTKVQIKDGRQVDDSKSKSSIFPCTLCKKKFYRKRRLDGHLRQHQGLKPAVCETCGKEFSKWSALDSHIMYSHNNAEKKFVCDEPDCDKSYIMKQSLKTHKKRAHATTPEDQKPESCLICELCGKSFTSVATLKKHSFIHSGQRPFKCTICPKKYITNHKLKEHMMRHEGIKNFVCPVCGMKKTTMHELKTHMNYHTREKLYPCKVCDAVFSSPGNRGRHFKIVHCGIKAYPCTYCDRSFGKAETLKHHVMTHTGEKPHVCTVCGKRFIQPVALQTHMKTHNKSR